MAFHCIGEFRGQASIGTVGNLGLLHQRETHILNTQKDTPYIGVYIWSTAPTSFVFKGSILSLCDILCDNNHIENNMGHFSLFASVQAIKYITDLE